ncbi:MAG: phosphate/phosphite/phosphonate ABC transporter substrate-binding protein [Lysobacterales bacterium]
MNSRFQSQRYWSRALLLMTLGCAGAHAQVSPAVAPPVVKAAPAMPGRVLVLGRVSNDPQRDFERLKPLLDYVVKQLEPHGVRAGRLLMAQDAQRMVSYLRRGKIDWVSETAGAAMALEERAGAVTQLVDMRHGESSYRTVFFTRRDSDIRTLADLRGRSLALQSPASTSAYFVPLAEVMDAGVTPLILASPYDRPPPAVMGFVLARSEFNISTWVAKRLIDAGAYSDSDWADRARLPEAFRESLVTFHVSEPVPRALELFRSDLEPALAVALRTVLINAGDDPQAAAALKAFFNTDRFQPVTSEQAATLAALRQSIVRIRAEVE